MLIGNHMCLIEWQQYRWPWVTFNVTVAVSKLFLTPIHQWIWHVGLLLTLCVYMDGKVSMVFNRNCSPKMTDFSRLGALQAVTYTIKVVVSKKWREIDTLLLHTTNRKYHVACVFVPFPVTFDDLESHSPNAGLIICNSTNICATLPRFLPRDAMHPRY